MLFAGSLQIINQITGEYMKNNIPQIICGFLVCLITFSGSAFGNRHFAHNTLPSNTNLLFIQVAKNGELVPTDAKTYTYKLILKNVEPFTSYFTDRPNRTTGMLHTRDFTNLWSSQDIKTNPPNVAIESSDIKNGTHINRVLVLSNPVYDVTKQEITYTATILGKTPKPNEKISLGYTVLFFDDVHWGGGTFG
jgi:hypothetical protein